ncbi:MAG: hypothetical protein DRP83_01765 [Planctomycetota bacterium]|nr:MAG: hypothetical protein DRP83_01765 [Planctomycetota bacterium]
MAMVPTNGGVPHGMRRAGPSGRPGAPSATSTGFSFTGKDFLRMLRRHKWLIGISVASCLVLSVVITFFWLRYAPSYTAQAILAVNPPKASELRGGTNLMGKDAIERILQSRAQSMRSQAVFEAALDDIRHTGWFAQASSEGDIDIVEKLLKEVSISVIRNTNFIAVSMTGRDPSDVTEIVNAICTAGVKDFKNLSNKDRNETIQHLEGELLRQRKKREAAAEVVQALLKRSTVTEATEAPQTLRAMQQALIGKMLEAQEMFYQARQAIEMVQGKTDEDLATLPEVQQMVEADPNVANLERQKASIEIALASMRSHFGDQHKTVKSYKSNLKATTDQLEQERKKATARAVDGLKQSRASFYKQAEERYIDLARQVNKGNKDLKDLNALQEKLVRSKEEINAADGSINQLQARLMDLRLLMRGEQPLVLLRNAQKPRKPSSPKYTILVPLGVFLGMVIGLGVSFLIEILDTSIKAPSDVFRRVELPMLGMVPHLDDVDEEVEDLRTAFLTHPNTIICEAFRQIRTTLTFSGPAEQQKTILVTSPMPEDGRTSVSLNLGNHLALGEKRVLIVDANFRQPAISKLFPDGSSDGLSNILVGQGKWQDMTHEIRPGLFIMKSGPQPPNPVELLGSEQMSQLISQLAAEFDHVVFDSAPLLVVSDAAVLSTRTDGTILVVRAGVNTYGIAQRARDMLTKLGSHIYGVVLNGVQVRAGGYLRKSYETFYEYRESSQAAAGLITAKAAVQDENADDQPAEEA